VAGSEGWGIVQSGASNTIPEGSLVTVGKPGLGTLRSSLWVSDSDVLMVPNALEEELGPSGSTLFQLGGTALRMLTDFVTLRPGDLVIQNAGNSGVGIMVSQLAKTMFAAPSISLVRRGSKSTQQIDDMVDYLTETGKNSMVILEEDLEDADYRRDIQSKIRQLSASGDLPKLGLNAVGGDCARSLLRLLDDGCTMVTYGGMSAKPSITVAAPQLIFKDFRILGYWHSRWMVRNSVPIKQTMINDLANAVANKGIAIPPCEVFALKDVAEALRWQASQDGGIRRKLVFDCSLK
jgi:trans-2-enoyl-CoA reductase